jgi:3'-phosphoadenosine 5'-phosphosulfate sulfotransferase (PAPS reductase)/FAD synthetase
MSETQGDFLRPDKGRLYHVGVSGGKDSTALLLWAVHESGYPLDRIQATFCNTHNENEKTYEHVRMLSEKVHPILWLEPELGFYDLAKKNRRFPAPLARFCTHELKLKPTKIYLEKLYDDGWDVTALSGERRGESLERAKLEPYDIHPFFGVRSFKPLLDWTIEQVWAIHEKYGIPRNPLYEEGASRVGCKLCIFSRKSEIRNVAERYPEVIDQIREQEKDQSVPLRPVTFFVHKKVPARFRSIDCRTKAGKDIKVASIDDVVRWSKTGKGAKAYEPHADEQVGSCQSGMCE